MDKGKDLNNRVYTLTDVFFVLIVGFVFFIPIFTNWYQLDMITILNDEFGYWGNAALISGYDWKPLMNETPYYSFGYSLLLVPIMSIFHNTAMIYQLAVLYNVLFLLFMLFIVYRITISLWPNIDLGFRCFLSIVSTLTLFNIFQARTAWPEVLLSLLMWISVFLINRVDKNPERLVNYLIVVFVFFCMCIVHKRTIPVVAIGAILLLIRIFFSKKNRILNVLVYIAFSSVAMIAYTILNNWHSSNFFGSAGAMNNESSTDMAQGYIGMLLHSFTDVILSFIGKCAINLVGTYFLAPIVIFIFCEGVVSFFKIKKGRLSVTEVYVVLSFLAMIALVTFQCLGNGRKDSPVYTRYSDFTLGPIIMYGLYYIVMEFRKRIPIFCAGTILGMILSVLTMDYIHQSEGFFNVPCSPLLGGIYEYVKENGGANVEAGVLYFWAKVSIVIMLSIFMLGLKNKHKYLFVLSIFSVLQLWICSLSNQSLNLTRDSFRGGTSKFVAMIQSDEKDVYYIKGDEQADYCVNAKFLQYQLAKRKINVIQENDIDDLESEAWVLSNTDLKLKRYAELEYVDETKMLTLYEKK